MEVMSRFKKLVSIKFIRCKKNGKIRFGVQRLISNRTVKCLTNVEGFALRSDDLEEITSLFSRFLRHPRVQAEIKFQSPYWRGKAAKQIQVAWRYRQKCLKRAKTSQVNETSRQTSSPVRRS